MRNSRSVDKNLPFIRIIKKKQTPTSSNTENHASQLRPPVTSSTKKEIQTHVGGGKSKVSFMGSELAIMKFAGLSHEPLNLHGKYKFMYYLVDIHAKTRNENGKYFIGDCSLTYLIPRLTVSQLKQVAKCHNVFVGSRWTIEQTRNVLLNHECQHCPKHLSLFNDIQSSHQKRDNKTISQRY